jgi:hypothetical protein
MTHNSRPVHRIGKWVFLGMDILGNGYSMLTLVLQLIKLQNIFLKKYEGSCWRDAVRIDRFSVSRD